MQVRIKDGKVSVDINEKDSRKMNRQEIEDFLQWIYDEGINDGKPDTPKEIHIKKGIEIAADALLKALEETKGIGEQRREKIIGLFRKYTDQSINVQDGREAQ
jgi:hypothetical protein